MGDEEEAFVEVNKLSVDSDKRMNHLLSVHQAFALEPNMMFFHPECKIWDELVIATKAVKDDKKLNIDFQWKGSFELKNSLNQNQSLVFDASSLSDNVRPTNPRLEEAYNIISLRPTIMHMEQNSVIFQNAIKENPVLLPEDALRKACRDFYFSYGRDIYFFVTAVDEFYKTDYIKNTTKHVYLDKQSSESYRKACSYLDTIEAEEFKEFRNELYQHEFNAYKDIIAMNRNISETKASDPTSKKVQFTNYEGIDVTWADNFKNPSDLVIEKEFLTGLYNILGKTAAKGFLKENNSRWYEALYDRIGMSDNFEYKELLKFHASDILYGFGYAKLKSGYYVEKREHTPKKLNYSLNFTKHKNKKEETNDLEK